MADRGAARPLLLQVLAWEFAQAAPATQRELLNTRCDDLLTEEVADALTGESAQARRAQALLSLAGTGRTTTLNATFTALGQPDRFPELLHDTATSPSAADTLAAVAAVAESAANTDWAKARALFYSAVASVLAGETDEAAAKLQGAITTDPAKQSGSPSYPSSAPPTPPSCNSSPICSKRDHDRHRPRRPARHHGQHAAPRRR